MLGNAYEYLLKQFADESGKKAGEFFTPRSVVRLLTRILDPQPTETIYDPACGSGGMLVEAVERDARGGRLDRAAAPLRAGGEPHDLRDRADEPLPARHRGLRDPAAATRCATRSSATTRAGSQRFDVVIANPPFSLKNWGAEVWATTRGAAPSCGVPPTGNGDFAWVQHMLASMSPDDGPRRRRDAARRAVPRRRREGASAQCLLEADLLEAVVGLAAEPLLLDPIPACLLIFRGDEAAPSAAGTCSSSTARSGSRRGATRTRWRPTTSRPSSPRTAPAPTPTARRASRSGSSRWPRSRRNGWDLNIGRYLSGAAEEVVDVETALAELREAQAALHEAEAEMWKRLEAAGYA